MPETPAPDPFASSVDRLDLAKALEELTPKQRAAVVLRYLEDRPVAEVADVLGVSPGAVKRQCHDAMARLRRVLTDSTLGGSERR